MNTEMKIVLLEAKNLGEDMVFTPFYPLGQVEIYPSTTLEQIPERVKDADIVVANKLPMCEETLKGAKHLKLVCLTATGINNLDGECGWLFYRCSCAAYFCHAFLCVGKTAFL